VLLGIKDHGITYTIEQTFKDLPDVFHGASVTVPEGTLAEDLMQIDGVKVSFTHSVSERLQADEVRAKREKNVWPVRILRRPDGPVVEGTGGPIGASSFAPPTSRLAKRATNFPPASAYQNDTFTSHVQTGVDKLHNAGILGAGIKVRSSSAQGAE